MTLLSPAERAQQVEQKRRRVLRWMRDYPFTHMDVLEVLLGYSRRTLQATLAKMERDGLIKGALIEVSYARPVKLWGLTHHGLHHAFDPGEPLGPRAVFDPKKVAASRLAHDLDVQLVHVRAQVAGWKAWKPAALLAEPLVAKGLNIPDAVAITATGETVALEIERTLKSARRYQEILVSYLQGRKLGLWQRVLYLSPDPVTAARIERAFRSIKTARFQGESFTVQPAHLAPFAFMSFDALFPPSTPVLRE